MAGKRSKFISIDQLTENLKSHSCYIGRINSTIYFSKTKRAFHNSTNTKPNKTMKLLALLFSLLLLSISAYDQSDERSLQKAKIKSLLACFDNGYVKLYFKKVTTTRCKLTLKLTEGGPKSCNKCGAYVSINDGSCDDIGDPVNEEGGDPFVGKTRYKTNDMGGTIRQFTKSIDNGFMVGDNAGKLAVVYDADGGVVACAKLVQTRRTKCPK